MDNLGGNISQNPRSISHGRALGLAA